MKVQKNAFVAIDYTLKLDSGELVDQSGPGQPLGFVYASGQIIPGLEKALEGMEVGHEAEVTVEPEDGYGQKNEFLMREIARNEFPDGVDLTPGMTFQASGPHGPIPFRIDSVTDDKVVADFNHPLAGERLNFKVKIAEVREATDAELEALQHACSDACCAECGEEC